MIFLILLVGFLGFGLDYAIYKWFDQSDKNKRILEDWVDFMIFIKLLKKRRERMKKKLILDLQNNIESLSMRNNSLLTLIEEIRE